jgi:hypothetical protein
MKKLIVIGSVMLFACSSSKNQQQSTAMDNISCVQELIKKFSAEEKKNPPRSIYRYTYNNDTVYYVPAPCCDFFSDLYNSKCNIIAHPDGGFTGRGDGKATDFFQQRANEKLIWQDLR